MPRPRRTTLERAQPWKCRMLRPVIIAPRDIGPVPQAGPSSIARSDRTSPPGICEWSSGSSATTPVRRLRQLFHVAHSLDDNEDATKAQQSDEGPRDGDRGSAGSPVNTFPDAAVYVIGRVAIRSACAMTLATVCWRVVPDSSSDRATVTARVVGQGIARRDEVASPGSGRRRAGTTKLADPPISVRRASFGSDPCSISSSHPTRPPVLSDRSHQPRGASPAHAGPAGPIAGDVIDACCYVSRT